VLALFIVCLPFVPAQYAAGKPTFVGALTGVLTSVIDYWCWSFGLTRLSSPLELLTLGAPIFLFGIAVLIVQYIDSQSTPNRALAK